MVEELKAILSLLGDMSEIGGWVLAGFILFKVTLEQLFLRLL